MFGISFWVIKSGRHPDQPLKIWGCSNSRFQASPSLPGLFSCSQQSLGKSQCQAGRMEMSNSGSWTSGLGDQCEQWGVSSGGWWVTHPTAWHQWATHSQEFPFCLFSLVLTSSRKKKIATFQQILVDECWSCGVISENWAFIDGFFGFLAQISGLCPFLELFDERFLTVFLLFIGSVLHTISFWAMRDSQAGRKAASHKPLQLLPLWASSSPFPCRYFPLYMMEIRWFYFPGNFLPVVKVDFGITTAIEQ